MKKLLLILLLTLSACASPDVSDAQINGGVVQNPVVTITMDDGGVITAELYPDKAPNTVANFVTLIQSGFYDGLTFHRTSDVFMIQGGDPNGNGTGGPGYTIAGEFASNNFTGNDITHKRGVLSMARGDLADSAGSQFFIMVADHVGEAAGLDGQYAAFGRVTEGMETADSIAAGPNTGYEGGYMALEPRVIQTITVETFGAEYTVVKS